MNKHLTLVIIFSLTISSLFGQAWEWATHFESTSFNTEVVDAVLHDEHIYALGTYRGTLAIDGNDYLSVGGNDLFLAKISLDGNIIWARTAGSSGNELASHVAIDGNNNVYIAGGFKNTCSFDGVDIISSDGFDGFIAKYNSDGIIQWAHNIASGSQNDRVTGMEVTLDGTIYVTGLLIGDVIIGDNTNSDTYNAGTDPRWMFVSSFTDNGLAIEYNWSNVYRTTSSTTIFRALSIADDNSIYIGGALGGSIFVDSDELTSNGAGDIIIIKLNNQGNNQWVRTGGGTSDDQLNSIYAYLNDVYIIGYVQGTGVIDSTATLPSSQYSAEGVDIISARYNIEGRLIWKNVIGGSGAHSGYGIRIHENIMVCSGYFSESITFNETTITSGGNTDAGFFVFDLKGNPVTAGSLTGTLEDRGQTVIYDGEGNTIIGGFFKSPELMHGDPPTSFNPGLINSSSDDSDGFLAKYQNPFSATFTTIKNITCNGGSNGELTVTTYFGTEPYSYSWEKDGVAFGSDINTITDLSAGVYKVTVTDANNKQTSTTHTLTQPQAITAGTPNLTDITCPSGDNGTITIYPEGGTGNLSYFWTTDDGLGLETEEQNQSGLIAGSYCVCITDENGCEFTDTYSLTDPEEITITGTVTNITNPGNNGAISIDNITGGTGTYPGDFSYSWTGPSSFSSPNKDISGLSNGGSYTITVTDNLSCTQEKTFQVSDEQIFNVWVDSKTNVSCFDGNNGAITIDYFHPDGAGDVTYTWTKDGDASFVDPAISNPTNLSQGTYNVSVTYVSTSETLNINGIEITQPTAISSSITTKAVNCYGESNGNAILNVSGGASPYTYSWKDDTNTEIATSKDISGRAAGNYTVFVTDKNECVESFSTTITQPEDIVVTIDESPVTCYDGSDGELSIINVTGGTGNFSNGDFSYLWSNTLTSQTISNLSAGNYSVTVTDTKGCEKFNTQSVTQAPLITASFSTTETTCPDGVDGKINVTSSEGGTGSLNYSINGIDFYASTEFTGLTPGEYTVWVRDDVGCERTFLVNVGQPPAFSATPTITDPTCPEMNDGIITLAATGGQTPRTYTWTGPSISGAPPHDRDQYELLQGDYTVQIEDANECLSEVYEFSLTAQYSSPTPTLENDAIDNTICLGDEVTFTAGGGSEYLFKVNGTEVQAQSANNVYVTSSLNNNDDVTVDVFSAQGCMATSTAITMTVNPLPEPTISTLDDLDFCEGETISVAFSIDITGDSYQWLLDGTEITGATDPSYTADAIGTYSVEVTDNGCTGVSNELVVTMNPLPTPTISTTDPLEWTEGESISVLFTVDITDADAYQWLKDGVAITDATQTTYTATEADIYNVLVTINGCEGMSNPLEINVVPPETYIVTFNVTNSAGDPIEGADITVDDLNPISTDNQGVVAIDLVDGSYSFIVNADNYDQYTGSFEVTGSDTPVNVQMVEVGINTQELLNVSAYPNPFGSEITISNPERVSNVIITSISGQKVLEFTLDGNRTINTSELPSGVYLLKLYGHEGKSSIFRMVKE